MAYVVPNSEAQFFISTGLSPSHENTLYFASQTEKDAYFGGLGKFSVANVTYQRENRGYIRVELPVSYLISCDYMRFRNNSFENKWFYAFITEVNYINNVTTEIGYVLDPLITWMGAFDLKQCMILRQHTTTDYIGSNVIEEDISCGHYVQEALDQCEIYNNEDSVLCMQYVSPDETQPNEYFGVFNPTEFITQDTPEQMANIIFNIVGENKVDNIVNIYMLPNKFSDPNSLGYENIAITKPYSSVDGYVPKNKKLFTYPYKYLTIENGEGNNKDFKYEYFNTVPQSQSTGDCNFILCGTPVNTVEVSLNPVNYNGQTTGVDPINSITMTHFPQCAFSYDNYRALLAQKNAYYDQSQYRNMVHGVINIANGAVQGSLSNLAEGNIAGAITGAIGGAGAAAAQSAADIATTAADNMIDNLVQPESGSSIEGTPTTDLMTMAHGKMYLFRKMSINQEKAKVIDNYFTMYGYKINEVTTPNMNARPHWTYVRTNGCNVGGAFPASDARAIENIFDNGVRFWHNLNEMGDYSLDNSPA